jgi:hypothetical protein
LVKRVNVFQKLPEVLAEGLDERHVSLLPEALELDAAHAAEDIIHRHLQHLCMGKEGDGARAEWSGIRGVSPSVLGSLERRRVNGAGMTPMTIFQDVKQAVL